MNNSKRRFEPDRRGRIIDTALDVIALYGVAGTTHRRVAEAADISLGSMTYYFSGIDELVAEAFTRLSHDISGRYLAALEAAQSVEEARETVVQLISGGILVNERTMTLQLELYAYMARNPPLRGLVADWIARSHAALRRHFDARTARALDALIEGVTIHNFARSETVPVEEVRMIVARLST